MEKQKKEQQQQQQQQQRTKSKKIELPARQPTKSRDSPAKIKLEPLQTSNGELLVKDAKDVENNKRTKQSKKSMQSMNLPSSVVDSTSQGRRDLAINVADEDCVEEEEEDDFVNLKPMTKPTPVLRDSSLGIMFNREGQSLGVINDNTYLDASALFTKRPAKHHAAQLETSNKLKKLFTIIMTLLVIIMILIGVIVAIAIVAFS